MERARSKKFRINKAAIIYGTFVSMRMEALQRAVGRVIKTAEQKIRESFRREKERYGNRQWKLAQGYRNRQSQRIERQIAKGQLKRENGLIKYSELAALSEVRKRNCEFNQRYLEKSLCEV